MAASGWLGAKWEGQAGDVGLSRGHRLIGEVPEEHQARVLGGDFRDCVVHWGDETPHKHEDDGEACGGPRGGESQERGSEEELKGRRL